MIEILLALSIGILIGIAIGGYASWVDAKHAVQKGNVDWKKEGK